jgi:hypothetical protein
MHGVRRWTFPGLLLLSGFTAACRNQGPNAEVAAAVLSVESFPETAERLGWLRIVDPRTGMVFRIHHDAKAESLARLSVPLLFQMYRDVAHYTAVEPAAVKWFDVAIVGDTLDYRLGSGDVTVWFVHASTEADFGTAGLVHLYHKVPHEQTHAAQGFPRSDLPRWLIEGHAEWVALRVGASRSPAVAETRRLELAEARRAAAPGQSLLDWRSVVRVRREAFLRHATPEQRERMNRDSTYFPPGPYQFQPGDFEGADLGGPAVLAHYADALEFFEELSRQVGESAILRWLRALWSVEPPVTPDALFILARENTGIDIRERLR